MTIGARLGAALARAEGLFLEPAPGTTHPRRRAASHERPSLQTLPSVEAVVLGLSAGCGASTVAQGLALQLAVPGERDAQLIAVRDQGATGAEPVPLGRVTRWTLPAALSGSDEVADYGRTLGRLTGGRRAVVWDVPPSEVERVAAVVPAADAMLLVARGNGEPALAELVSRMLCERFGAVLLVANRVSEPERWAGRALVSVPESRLGAAFVNRGRVPGGAFGAALAELAELVERRS